MKRALRHNLRRLAAAACFLALVPTFAQKAAERAPVTPELLESRILAVEESEDLDQAAKDRVIKLHRDSIASLETARANQKATEAFQQQMREAPAEAATIREKIEERRATDPTADLRINSWTPPDKLKQRLEAQLAERTAVEANLSAIDGRLEEQSQRATQAHDRIAAVRVLVEEAEQQADVPDPEESPLLAEARRWSRATRLEALRTEITMLEQELLSQDARIKLLRAQRDRDALTAEQMGRRIDVLQAAYAASTIVQADRAMDQATAMLDGPSAAVPAVRELATDNVLLVETLRKQVAELQSLSAQESLTRPQASRLAEAVRLTRRKLRLAGTRAPLGAAIREQRLQLPDAAEYAKTRRDVGRATVVASLRLVDNEEERRAMNDLEAYVAARLERADAGPLASGPRADLEALLNTRRALLDRLIANDNTQIRRLDDFDVVLRKLVKETTAFDEFLAERLIWVRSSEAINLESLGTLSDELAAFFSPTDWLQTAALATEGPWRISAILIAVVIAAVLVLYRKKIRAELVERGKSVGRVHQDSMRSTFEALGLTLLLALPVPLVLGVIGLALVTADDATTFSEGVAAGLLGTVGMLLLFVTLRELYEPGGVAERHFGWDSATLARLRRQLAWFLGLGLPLYFVTASAIRMRPDTTGGTLGLLAFTGLMACVAGLFIGVGHPTRGTIRHFLSLNRGGVWWRWRYVWFPLAVSVPVVLAVLGLVGYTHTAAELTYRVAASTWLLTGLWVGRAIVRRWLLMTRRRLAYEAAVAARKAAQETQLADPKTSAEEIGGPDVDFVALDTDSRKLLNATVALLAILGLAGIWGQMIPALGVLKQVNLWNKAAVIEGAEQLVPVTLADVLLALLIGIGGWIIAKNLPSLLDIILMKRGKVAAGIRYAISTLSRYAIAAIAALWVLGLLGATWSQMGWAVAALSVGIGFGLQEIVANFICGLILLFERPVRIGDVVTIGDASGTVTRIRIRATTIRDFEKKELIVPNKELITGRLLNWTLSDSMTRLDVTVGVAYGTNVNRAMALLREAAEENERVLEDPAPVVLFNEFGDSSLALRLFAHVAILADRGPAITELHSAIDRKFREAGIEIPFPQRDVHVLSEGEMPAPRSDEDSTREAEMSV